MHTTRYVFVLVSLVLFSSTYLVKAQQIEITDPTLETPEEYRISQVRVQGNQTLERNSSSIPADWLKER